MDEQTFWDLVGGLGHNPVDQAYERLADLLSHHGAASIRDFADHLARALHALDTPAHHRATDSAGDFLGVRCAAVAAGAVAYEKVLRSPAELAGFAVGATALLSVAGRAYATSTRTGWRHELPVSHETGSNADAWGTHWLHPHLGTTTRDGRAPRAYMIALQHVLAALDADPAWQAWWRRSGMPECELGIVAEGRLDHLRPSADIRVRARVRANFTCAAPRADRSPAEQQGYLTLAQIHQFFG